MIYWQDNILESDLLESAFQDQKVVLIVDENVLTLYQKKIVHFCHRLKADLLACPTGEMNKSRATKEKLENTLLERGFDSNLHILAIGGGVTTDLAGYLAATYHRGIKVSFMPTTLMAMVDASIGGKNGVNVKQGKNLIGTIHYPENILCDLHFLDSLPKDQLRSGMAEMLKHGLIADSDYFIAFDGRSINKEAVQHNQKIKLAIIEQDHMDHVSRHLLNFGHTAAHAIEKVSQYSLLHGDAVALGMVIESALSNLLGILPNDHYEAIVKKINGLHYPSYIHLDGIYQAMQSDKKNKNRVPHFVLLKEIGKVYREASQTIFPVEERLVAATLDKVYHDLCRD